MGRRRYISRNLLAGPSAGLVAALITSASASAALPDLQLVSQGSGRSSDNKQARAECPDGTGPLGIGARVRHGQNQVKLDELERRLGAAVRVHASEDEDGTDAQWSVRAYAICADASLHGGSGGAFFPFPGFDSSSPKSVTATPCPNERRLTGAEGSVSGARGTYPGEVFLSALIPGVDQESATARANEDEDGTNADWRMYGGGICSATTLPGWERVARTGPTNSRNKHATARCPRDKRVVGTGGQIIGGRGQVGITYLFPDEDLTRVHVRGAEDQDGMDAGWAVRAYAVCASGPPRSRT
jgi:hypothetical protein